MGGRHNDNLQENHKWVKNKEEEESMCLRPVFSLSAHCVCVCVCVVCVCVCVCVPVRVEANTQ